MRQGLFKAERIVSGFLRFLSLLKIFSVRDVQARYRGSWLGVFWSILNPVLLLIIYSFVFGVIFKARWPNVNGIEVNFSLLLFCGLITHMMLADVLSRSSTTISDNANYVKKVVFPLALFGCVISVSALFHFVISLFILLICAIFLGVNLGVALIFLPLLLVQYWLFCLGISFFVSVLGVFFKDMSYIVGFVSTALLFLSPIFYSADSVPANFQLVLQANPLTYYVDSFRLVTIYNEIPSLEDAIFSLVVAVVTFCFGFIFFSRVKATFADVI